MVDSTKPAPTDSADSIDTFDAVLGAVVSVVLLMLVEGRMLWLFGTLVGGAMMLMLRKTAMSVRQTAAPSKHPAALSPRFRNDVTGVGRP